MDLEGPLQLWMGWIMVHELLSPCLVSIGDGVRGVKAPDIVCRDTLEVD